jgi:hypothetical protein
MSHTASDVALCCAVQTGDLYCKSHKRVKCSFAQCGVDVNLEDCSSFSDIEVVSFKQFLPV